MTPDMASDFLSHLQIWAVFGLIIGALYLYITEKLPMEITSIGAICALIAFFHFFPLPDEQGANRLGSTRLVSGFANPALLTVLGLLVVGQGMVRTGVLARGANFLLTSFNNHPHLSIMTVFAVITLTSGVLNSVPVVIVFIPIIQSMAERLGMPPGKVMMGVSFSAALGGSMTLIGSGSNLLVSGELVELGEAPLTFFQFTIPGALLAFIGLIYVGVVMPRLLRDRGSLASRIMERSAKYFLAQIPVGTNSRLVETRVTGGVLAALPEVRVRMVLRGERVTTPPFHDFQLKAGDLVVVAASRKALAGAMAEVPGLLASTQPASAEPVESGERVLAEIMIPPGSMMARRRLYQTGFQFRSRCAVLGIQRRSRMFRSRMTDVALEPGDVLLIQGRPDDIEALRNDSDVVLMAGSREALPKVHGASRALAIFLCVVAAAATGLLPVVLAALFGAAAMVGLRVLNVRQAARALDSRIFTTIPATLAMGMAMHETGGSEFLAQALIWPAMDAGPLIALSGFFLLMAILANIIGSNAAAVLFTPIAVGLAHETGLGVDLLAVAVVLASNCAFATPTGYQTSLLVMGPGHYRFADFPRAGAPLILLLWGAFTGYAMMIL